VAFSRDVVSTRQPPCRRARSSSLLVVAEPVNDPGITPTMALAGGSPTRLIRLAEKNANRVPFEGRNQVRLDRNGGKAIANAIPAGS
jgi:hypothetical protein